jgi:hypothetical protein
VSEGQRSFKSERYNFDLVTVLIEFHSAIDQLSEVVERVLQTIGEETGWSACVMVGGPMPRRQGAISIKT